MITKKIEILKEHGFQTIKKPSSVILPDRFRGRPEIKSGININIADIVCKICPAKAISLNPFSIDLGRCVFCGECERICPSYIRFTNDFKMASVSREALIVKEGDTEIDFCKGNIHPEINDIFKRTLKLRQVSAGGDNSSEMELNASTNVNFDIGRYGIDFVASPRHADGLVITGPITKNMSEALDNCYSCIPEPKVLILAEADAISGSLYGEDNKAVDRYFVKQHHIDLFIPGNPVHPLSFIYGCINTFNINQG